jgi:DNA-binding CsgD family transcriptional regulator
MDCGREDLSGNSDHSLISENTVNFHQKNMQKKFNAPNKTQIACYAAATGLI